MRRLLTLRWVLVHVAVLVLVTGFLALGWWQITRAADGNALSYGYSLEWPVFAAFVVWVWVTEMRKALRDQSPQGTGTVESALSAPTVRAAQERPRRKRNELAYDDSNDPELAAYNHYLAWRNAHPHATAADYPGYSTEPALDSRT